METAIAVLVFLFGLYGGAAWVYIAGGYSVGLSSVATAMTPCYVVLLIAGMRAARRKLSRGATVALLVGAVLVGVVLWFGHQRVSYRKQGQAVGVGLACYDFQCRLGEWLADARVGRDERREALRTLAATGGVGARPIRVGRDALQAPRDCQYRIESGVLRCAIHDVPAVLTRGARPFRPACAGPVRVPADLLLR